MLCIMAGRHPAALRPADHRADPVIEDAVAKGYLESGLVYAIPGFKTHNAAVEGRLSVTRSAKRQNLSAACWVADQDGTQCYKDCADPRAPHQVHFRLWTKESARAHIFRQTGGDPANLKYNPWTQHRTRRFGDDGSRPGS